MMKSIFYVTVITMNIQQKRTTINLATTTSIIVPGSNKIINIFSSNNDIVIPCGNITKVCRYNKVVQFCKST